jgi:hypothetical protein
MASHSIPESDIEWFRGLVRQWMGAWNSHEPDRVVARRAARLVPLARLGQVQRADGPARLCTDRAAVGGRRRGLHEYRDGRSSKLRVVFDLMSASRQLGLMPASGSHAEHALAAAQRGLVRARQAYRRRF